MDNMTQLPPRRFREGDPRAQDVIRLHAVMMQNRSGFEQHWQEIADRILVRKYDFTKGKMTPSNETRGEKRSQKQFDSTAALALERFTAAMESMLTPRNARWHTLTTRDKHLRDNLRVKRYLEEVTDILFAHRYAPHANFASQANEVYTDLGAFGTGVMYVEPDYEHKSLSYCSTPLEQSYFLLDAKGRVVEFHRDYELEAHQAVREFGNECPDAILYQVKHNPRARYRFLHVVKGNDLRDPNRLDAAGKKFSSTYISITGTKIVREGGYNTFPFMPTRYATGTKEEYGRSPAMMVLPTIKGLNEMKKTILRAAEKKVNPPLMLTEDGLLRAFDLRAGGLNAGALDAQGNQRVRPLEVGGDVGLGLDLMQQEQKTINEAFLVTLFQILVETPQMTATEAMLRAQEKGALLAPTMGRQQSEFLGPLIAREISILAEFGAFPDMPEELIEAGGEIEIQYESPIMQAQKAGDGVAILNTLEAVTPLAQIDPSVLDAFDMVETANILAESNGFPSRALLSKEDRDAKKEAKAQEAQAAQLLAAAPVVASASKDFAQAQSLAGSSPNQVAPEILGPL